MRSIDRETARRQLDKRLSQLNADAFARPPRGWVKAIREALGMTTAQLAKRLGVSQPRVVGIEQAEAKGAITLDSLERAAHALDCRLVYALVPRKPLDALVEARAARLAEKRLEPTRHTMALEAQAMDTRDEDKQRARLIRKLVEQAGTELWDDA
ncbi:mobile mystery protein A [Thiobacillus sp.]|uniref:mobile mystery protein A n=1 Tax=Thiobacillus sp. TaxID=924 RepID=UPI0011D3E8BE|nr:mobile mystery protein A [Thiobacillus sp.]TXH74917.1 MAG: mobile mystery protein A [Thiobacillus sp.]